MAFTLLYMIDGSSVQDSCIHRRKTRKKYLRL